MSHIAYFKRLAKNLFRDYKTQYSYIDSVSGDKWYGYLPKFFDMEQIFFDFYDKFDEKNFCLMKAQHLLAQMLKFEKWQDLLDASNDELELAKLIWENRNRVSPLGWTYVVMEIEEQTGKNMSAGDQIQTLKSALDLDREAFDYTEDEDPNYLLDERSKNECEKLYHERQKPEQVPNYTSVEHSSEQISTLPLSKENRAEFIKIANEVFESVILRIEPQNPEITRKLWYEKNYAEDFIDNGLLKKDMLPITKDYAVSLIDAFLIPVVISLVADTDKEE